MDEKFDPKENIIGEIFSKKKKDNYNWKKM
jgi:hypothetical protein